MTNMLMVIIYAPFVAINLILLISTILKKNRVTFSYLYVVLCVLILGWIVLESLQYILINPYWIGFIYSARFMFIAFIPTIFLFLIAGFYNLHKSVPWWFLLSLLILDAIISIVAITSMLHNQFHIDTRVDTQGELTLISSQVGILYYACVALMQIPVIGFAVVLLAHYRRLPSAYRATLLILFLGLFFYVAGLIVEGFSFDGGSPINFSLVSVCIANLLFYIAVSSNGRSDYLNIWHRDIFDYLDEAILIIDSGGLVIDANHQAETLFSNLGFEINGLSVDEVWEKTLETGKVSYRHLENEEKKLVSEDMYIIDGQYPLVYEIRYHKISKTNKTKAGEFITLTQVTRNRLFIERYQDLAGVDSLTGLKNRFSYERSLRDWDRAENLPLSIIIGDVNGLKLLNDTEGHHAGDKLLRMIAEIIKKCCPPEGLAARIGGDEYVILLKHHSEEDVQSIITCIHKSIAETKDFPYSISIALGSATKTCVGENINLVSNKADAEMYAVKKAGDSL